MSYDPSTQTQTLTTPVGPRLSLTDAIASQLIRLIMDGRFKPGDQLPTESELAKQFQVGRGSVREALKALGVIGLTRVERGKGTFINEHSNFLIGPISLGVDARVEIESLIEARSLIEVKLAGLAAERAVPEEIRSIESYLQRMRTATAPEQSSIFLEADISFHLAIASAAHNRILSQFLTLIRNLMKEWIAMNLQDRGVAALALQHHTQIFEAIIEHRPAAASEAMTRHLQRRENFYPNSIASHLPEV